VEAKDILKIHQDLDRLRCCVLLLDDMYCVRYANRAALRALKARNEADLVPPAAGTLQAAAAPPPSSPANSAGGAPASAPVLDSTEPLQVRAETSPRAAHMAYCGCMFAMTGHE
jgi:hypothetical protein